MYMCFLKLHCTRKYSNLIKSDDLVFTYNRGYIITIFSNKEYLSSEYSHPTEKNQSELIPII